MLKRAHEAESGLGRADGPFSLAAAVELHRLMAYKDEYEVARLHLSQTARAEIEREFGTNGRVIFHLTPPVLHAIGLKRKLRLGVSARLSFHFLRAGRRLRGTKLDPFGHSRYRRQERTVRDEYVDTIERLSSALTHENYRRAVELADLPAMIRGFGDVKARALAQYRAQREKLSVTL